MAGRERGCPCDLTKGQRLRKVRSGTGFLAGISFPAAIFKVTR